MQFLYTALLALSLTAALSFPLYADDDDDELFDDDIAEEQIEDENTTTSDDMLDDDELEDEDDDEIELTDNHIEDGDHESADEREDDDNLLKHPDELAARENDEAFDHEGYRASAGEILAIDMNPTAVELAEASGFRILDSSTLRGLGKTMHLLAIPDELRLDKALERLRKDDPSGLYDANHFYDNSAAERADQLQLTLRPLADHGKVKRIGLIDSAIDQTHPSLINANIIEQRFVHHANTRRPLPVQHGTAVASLLVGRTDGFNGLLPEAQLYNAAVFYRDDSEYIKADARALIRGLDWLASQQIAIINMSLSGPPNLLLQQVLQQLHEHGFTIVAAAGNYGPAAPVAYPAGYQSVVAVTAVDRFHRIYRRANRGEHLDFASYGVAVRAADSKGTITTVNGTSYAAPVVSAQLAMHLYTPNVKKREQLLSQMRAATLDLGPPGHDPIFGYGLLQPELTD